MSGAVLRPAPHQLDVEPTLSVADSRHMSSGITHALVSARHAHTFRPGRLPAIVRTARPSYALKVILPVRIFTVKQFSDAYRKIVMIPPLAAHLVGRNAHSASTVSVRRRTSASTRWCRGGSLSRPIRKHRIATMLRSTAMRACVRIVTSVERIVRRRMPRINPRTCGVGAGLGPPCFAPVAHWPNNKKGRPIRPALSELLCAGQALA